MARRDNDDERKAMKRPDRGAIKGEQQEEGQEEEAQRERSQETETSRSQRQLGNAAIAAMLSAAAGGGGTGGGGAEVEMARRKAAQDKDGQDYGGEDEPADPALADDIDLTEGWNAGTTQPSDRLEFLEAMPDDELPPEDPTWLSSLRSVRDAPRPPPSSANDALLQPSAAILARSITGWCRGAARLAGPVLHRRAWARLVTHPGSLLQDPWGRVLILRGRTAALSVGVVLAGMRRADASTCAFVDFLLELEARDNLVRAARLSLGENERPQAKSIVAQLLEGADGRVEPRPLEDAPAAALAATLRALLVLDDPLDLVPRFTGVAPDEEEDDDPLGLQAIIVAHTGGEKDPHEALFKSAIQAAERVAAAIYLTRLRFAGTSAAIADAAELWSAGAPAGALIDAMGTLDARTNGTMQLLRDIARAAQKRQVGAAGLRQGLLRAARDLQKGQDEAVAQLSAVIGGILPAEPAFAPLEAAPQDPLGEAHADGSPDQALPWLASLPDSLDRDAAIVFTRLATRPDASGEIAGLLALRDRAAAERAELLAAAANLAAGAACMHLGRYEEAAAVGAANARFGLSRRNGAIAAEGALLATEALLAAGDLEAAERNRRQVGAALWQMGARGALSLLARWAPPGDEPEDAPMAQIAPPLPDQAPIEGLDGE